MAAERPLLQARPRRAPLRRRDSNWVIAGRHFDAKDIVPHLFEETDPGFHERCKPGDIIVAGRNFGMGPK